jgi:aspartyl/glutamyl-tRNA(Asn/Gln) amidotransferase C subunit
MQVYIFPIIRILPEWQDLVPEFNNTLSMINQMNEVESVSDLVVTNAVDISDLREDEIQESIPQELALINAPKQRKGCYNVPRVVD